MIYVASPYSHPDEAIRESRFRWAETFAAHRLSVGDPVFSPIVYCHPLAETHRLPTDADYWAAVNRAFMARAERFALLALDGWQTSRGVAAELRWRREFRLPIEVWMPRGYIRADGFRRLAVGDPTDNDLREALA